MQCVSYKKKVPKYSWRPTSALQNKAQAKHKPISFTMAAFYSPAKNVEQKNDEEFEPRLQVKVTDMGETNPLVKNARY